MNITHELKDDLVVLLNVSLASDEIREQVAEQLKNMRKTAQMPGFRPGKTPAALIEKKFGKAVRFDIINKKSGKEIADYLKEQKIKTVGGLLVEHDENSYTPEQTDYELQLSVGLLPKFPSAIDSSVTLPHYTIPTDQEELEEMITNARENYGERQEVEDVQPKDLLYVSARELSDKGEPLEGGIELEETYIMPQFVIDEEIRNQLLAAHKDDSLTIDLHKAYDGKEVEIASLLHIEQDKVSEHKNPFEIRINRILRNTPHELDEKLFKLMLGPDTKVTTEEELREELTKIQAERNANMSRDLFTTTATRYILEQVKDLPISEEHIRLQLNEQQEDETAEEYEQRVQSVIPYLRYRYILSDLCEQLGVEVPQELVREMISDDVKRRIQAAGLGQLLTNDDFVNRIVEDTLSKGGEELFRAQEQAREQAFAAKVKELVTLDEHEVASIKDFYEVFNQEQKLVNELLGNPSAEEEEPATED
ncbi:MAG: peptidylprolyl isomerase [Porphyromonas sp.]|uniref:trigger factor n=1 Tax=Porphyromonas sp. TaxID=1924944 RepID=UPI001A62C657|nr:trigger factor [Porphyromonas sp.]MBL6453145.1 peptidylprolyl isomerase [Porphyromonas sp.]